MTFKRTHSHLLCFQKRTFLKRKILYLVIKHLQLKIFLLKFLKVQFISTQKNVVAFSMNVWLTESFPTHWKEQMLLRFSKKRTIMKTKTIAQWVCSQPFKKCLKNYYLNKLMIICKVNSQSILQLFAKTTADRIPLFLRKGCF